MRTRRVVLFAALAAMLALRGQGSGAARPPASASWPSGPPARPSRWARTPELRAERRSRRRRRRARRRPSSVARAQGLGCRQADVRVVVEPSAGVAAAEDAVAAAGGHVEASADGLVQALVPPALARRSSPPRPASAMCGRRTTPFPRGRRRGRRRNRTPPSGRPPATTAPASRSRSSTSASRLPGAARDGAAGLGHDRSTTAAAGSTSSSGRGDEPRHRGRRARPPDGPGRPALPDLHRHRGRPEARRAGRDRRRRQDRQPLGRLVQHEPRRRHRRRRAAPTRRSRTRAPTGSSGSTRPATTPRSTGAARFTSDAANADDATTSRPATRSTASPIAAGAQVCAFLKWDGWPVTSEDFDLYLVRDERQLGRRRLGSTTSPAGPDAPTEDLCYTNTGAQRRTSGSGSSATAPPTTPRFDLYVRRRLEPPVLGRRGKHHRARLVAERPRGRRRLLADRRDRVLQLAGPDDRRAAQAGSRRARQRLDRDLRQRRRHLRASRASSARPPRRRRSRGRPRSCSARNPTLTPAGPRGGARADVVHLGPGAVRAEQHGRPWAAAAWRT